MFILCEFFVYSEIFSKFAPENKKIYDYDSSRVECADMARHGRDSRQ
jgi:hypothetical protein